LSHTANDDHLFSEIQGGSSQALDTLYRKVGPGMLRFLRSIRCPNPEDVLQDTFLALFQQAADLRPDTNIQAWLFKVARNRAFKCVSKMHTIPVDDTNLTADTPNPDHTIMVQKAIRSMEEPFRSTLALFHWEGFTLQEISGITGTPVNTVKTRLFRARKMLKESILKGTKRTGSGTSSNSSPFLSLTRTLNNTADKVMYDLKFVLSSKSARIRKIILSSLNLLRGECHEL
jgi:RNA polymerase sigma-70 factor (ECF subfamily)